MNTTTTTEATTTAAEPELKARENEAEYGPATAAALAAAVADQRAKYPGGDGPTYDPAALGDDAAAVNVEEQLFWDQTAARIAVAHVEASTETRIGEDGQAFFSLAQPEHVAMHAASVADALLAQRRKRQGLAVLSLPSLDGTHGCDTCEEPEAVA